ncbi:MAG: alpha/beta hydrolase [Thermodesulfobacteriota bacterium]
MSRQTDKSHGRALMALLALATYMVCAGMPSPCGAGEPQRVAFEATDGTPLSGHLFGTGTTGVILAHMYPADQKSWVPFARKLAKEGYLVLTFDFRGYGESGGEKVISEIDRDLEGAYRFLRPKVKKIFLVGASMGGTAAIRVAAENPTAGVVTLSAPMAFRGLDAGKAVQKLSVPCLFVAAEQDGYAAASAREFNKTVKSSECLLLIVPGPDHGTRLFDSTSGTKVEEAILRFLKEH